MEEQHEVDLEDGLHEDAPSGPLGKPPLHDQSSVWITALLWRHSCCTHHQTACIFLPRSSQQVCPGSLSLCACMHPLAEVATPSVHPMTNLTQALIWFHTRLVLMLQPGMLC